MLLIIHQIQQSIFNKWFGTILKMLTYFRFISENIKFQRWTFTNKYTSSDFYLYLIDGFGSAACVIAGPSTVTSPLPDAVKFCWVARASVRDSRQRERSEAMELKVTHAEMKVWRNWRHAFRRPRVAHHRDSRGRESAHKGADDALL